MEEREGEYANNLLETYREKFAQMPWNDFYCDDEGFRLHKRLRKYGLIQKAQKINKKATSWWKRLKNSD